ncbi:MAG: TetR/AcrR family transcriptional regulator [Verrucomicrobia bacterium]|nr:TetR/AcrR family transcriptional regulator [Verrucomicrobiota bacterium]
MKKTRTGNSRELLIDAAEAVVLRDGGSTLTLDAVAAEAKVSKGGLLYHFPSKDALIEAMIERLIRTFTASLELALQSEPPTRGRFARALVRAMFDRPPELAEKESRMSASLLAGVANQPRLLDPLRNAYARWMKAVAADGLPPGRSMAVFAALDGIWLWSLFGIYQPTPTQLRAIRIVLEELIATDAS